MLVTALLAAALAGFSLYQFNRLNGSDELYGTVVKSKPLMTDIELSHVAKGRVALADWRGQLLLVFFGFSNCPDVCPLTMGRLAKIYQDLGEPEAVQIVMITVDPEHDTPKVIQDYVEGFHSDFIGLSGSNNDIAEAAKAFFVGYAGIDNQNFTHTDSVALLDKKGRMRLVYNQSKVMRLESDLKQILAKGF